MAINNMTVGRQYSLTFYDPNTGDTVDFGDVQNFKTVAAKHLINSKPYNAVPRFGYIPDGYNGTLEIVRTNQNLEEFQLAQVALFNAGQNTLAGTLNETVTEADGSTSRYQYVGFVFWLNDSAVSRENPTKMSAEWHASDKLQLA